MSGFGANPVTTTQGSLATNQFPTPSVAVPGTANGDLTTLEGGPASTDSNNNLTAPVSVYVKNGGDVTQGAMADAANANTVIGQLKQIKTNTTSQTVTANAGTGNFNVIQATGSNLHTVVDSGTLGVSSLPSLPAGSAVIGHVIVDSAGAVTVTSLPTLPSGTNVIGHVIADSGSTTAVTQATGTNLHAVVDSGTVTANVGTTNGLALDTSVSGVIVSQGSTTSGEKGPLVQGAVTTSAPTYTTTQTSPISLTTAGAVRTDASATTQPVSGTVTANQGGTWTVQPGNTANTTAWKVDNSAVTQPVSGTFWQATQPVSAASLPLPSGASTAAKQPALGTAGSAASDVLSVQGIASMTALKVDGSAVTQPVNTAQINGVTPTMGNGVSGTGVQRVTIASDSTGQVTLAAGSAVIGHVVADSGSTTAATQATASNLNAQVVGAVASAGSNAGNPIKVGGAFNTTQPTVTNGQIVDAQMTARGAQIVATGTDAFNTVVNSITAALTQANQIPVSTAAAQGKLTLTGTLTANSDNSITFSGGATVARRIRIQNESGGTIYWETDATASTGSPSLVSPAANAVSVEWIAIQCTTLHIWIPTAGTTTLNGTGGLKVTAYA